ncbi:MAG: adenosine monophosphate-protein transferase [Thermoprotei archaeon]|mgnify:CR=1 FL=1|nr:MAG: adenosine monophosphate-protein transferase [Thermoprotei archaeon]RLE97836.1 MAG: adenosine monophosphate-protein transferase [Thermoprotei archaeon]
MSAVKLLSAKIDVPEGVNVILGQAHFIKTVEDLYEAVVSSVPNVRFGLAFCEASGDRLVRVEGNDEELRKLAAKAALDVGAGHFFIIYVRGAWPINMLNSLKNVQEVVTLYCATANPVEVIVAETEQGRAVLGVVDGYKPLGIEDEAKARERMEFLRKIGYKRGL